MEDGAPPVQIGHYRLGKTLGIGSFGKVKLATHVVTGHQVAIKILNRARIRSLSMEDKVRREICILRLLRHPHVIRIYDVVETPSDIFLIMEYLSRGEIFDLVVSRGRLAPEDARQVFHQLISGVEFLHYKRVIHRDLKPENLLLDENLNIKIADFGLSNVMRDGEFLRTSCGSPNYAAPEIISGALYAGPEVDVWSCGVILYALLCGTLPFDDENIPVLFKKIKGCEYTLPSHLSELSRDLIARMLTVEPTKRITVPEIRQHAWFQTNLPPYLGRPPRSFDIDVDVADADIADEVAGLPFGGESTTREEVLAAIAPGAPRRLSDLRVAYHLALDHKHRRRRLQELREATAGAVVLSPPAFSPPTSPPSTSLLSLDGTGPGDGAGAAAAAAADALPESAASPPRPPPPQQQRPAPLAPPPGVLPASAAGALAQPVPGPTTVQMHYARRRRWYLGIQSKKEPAHVMAEVFKALFALRCDWRVVSAYRLVCRWAPSGAGAPGAAGARLEEAKLPEGSPSPAPSPQQQEEEELVKVSLQLYKVQANIYLLDFHKLQGDAFSFMSLCARIITELKTLSAASRSARTSHG